MKPAFGVDKMKGQEFIFSAPSFGGACSDTTPHSCDSAAFRRTFAAHAEGWECPQAFSHPLCDIRHGACSDTTPHSCNGFGSTRVFCPAYRYPKTSALLGYLHLRLRCQHTTQLRQCSIPPHVCRTRRGGENVRGHSPPPAQLFKSSTTNGS